MKSGTFCCRNSISVRQQVRFLHSKTFSWRSCQAMRRTELHIYWSPFRFPSDFSQSLDYFPGCRWHRLRGQCWPHLILTGRGRPLPCLRNTDDVWSIFHSNILTAACDHCLFENSRKILLASHPFSSRKSFIAALSSFVNDIVYVYICSLVTSLLMSLCIHVKWVH